MIPILYPHQLLGIRYGKGHQSWIGRSFLQMTSIQLHARFCLVFHGPKKSNQQLLQEKGENWFLH